MKAKYLVMEKRYLIKFFAAKNPWTVLFFIIPLLAVFNLLIIKEGSYSLFKLLALLPIALLYWSLVEYIIHRNYFHWVPKNKTLRWVTGSFHLYHHENPEDMEVINSGWITATIGAAFHFSVFHFLFQVDYLSSLYLTADLIAIYYGYEWVHYFVHHKIYKHGLMRYLQNFHLTHHVSPRKNFGQITPLWDYLLGTIRPNMETKDNASMRKLVKGASV